MEDNAYISSGRYYNYRDTKTAEIKKARALEDIIKELPLLEERVNHLDKRIAETDSIKYKNALLNTEKYKRVSSESLEIALDLLRDELEVERSKIVSMIKNTKR